jgi:hypothetical protein
VTDTAEFPYRLALGWITKAALEASSAYLIVNFPLQSDQVSVYVNPWGPPDDQYTTYPAQTRYGQSSDQTQFSDGPVVFDWGLTYFTENMVAYWEGLIFGGVGMYPDATTQNIQVTVKTRKHNGEFGVYQCYANRAAPNQKMKRGNRGVEAYIQSFVQGTEITA